MSQAPPVMTSQSEQTAAKPRSCVVCRRRKVKCDKGSPCSNCRQANIACVLPSTDRPPRWARRLERFGSNIDAAFNTPNPPVMERVRHLENLVKKLRLQLEEARATNVLSSNGTPGTRTPGRSSHGHQSQESPTKTTADSIQKPFGRLVLEDANKSRYVSSGFWSQVNDELDGLDYDTSEDEVSNDTPANDTPTSIQELQRTPAERYSFLFRHDPYVCTPDLRDFHPLPSQIPFILDVFSENVNSITQTVHMPTVKKMIRDLRGNDLTNLTPANAALMFSIYYAAVNSMEENDVVTNFGCSKPDLSLKFRIGLEHALARADFLNVADLVLVQALANFLCLVRRDDSPQFVWMMTGLLIRMGQAIGLHRDGAHFTHLSSYEIEMRRRVWWTLCVLDVRASEDQGTEYTIPLGSFDTRLPLNLNDADIGPTMTNTPTPRKGLTDMTFAIVSFELCQVAKQMMTKSANESAPNMEEQGRLLDEFSQKLNQGYLQYTDETNDISYWVAVVIARLMMAKMTLLIHRPILFSSLSKSLSVEFKTKLFNAAIEIAEYNHALNEEQACRHWRWVYQTYTHWYAVVHLLLEVSRRPWSPIAERAWVALHSPWLIPTQSHMNKNLRIWVPVRRLIVKARKHRDDELERLRRDPQTAQRLEVEDRNMPLPASPGTISTGANVVEMMTEQWRQLLTDPEGSSNDTEMFGRPIQGPTGPSPQASRSDGPSTTSMPAYTVEDSGMPDARPEPTQFDTARHGSGWHLPSSSSKSLTVSQTKAPSDIAVGQIIGPAYGAIPGVSGPGFAGWLWADTDPSVDVFANMDWDPIKVNMDLDNEVDWYKWIESANGLG